LPPAGSGSTDPAFCSGSGTPDPLMRPSLVEILDIGVEHALELLLLQNKQMVEAFTPHTPEKALADGIRSRSAIRCCENLDATRVRNPREARPKLAIILSKKVFRPLSIGGGFPQRYVRSRRRWDIE
jgi:hypothetical protein